MPSIFDISLDQGVWSVHLARALLWRVVQPPPTSLQWLGVGKEGEEVICDFGKNEGCGLMTCDRQRNLWEAMSKDSEGDAQVVNVRYAFL